CSDRPPSVAPELSHLNPDAVVHWWPHDHLSPDLPESPHPGQTDLPVSLPVLQSCRLLQQTIHPHQGYNSPPLREPEGHGPSYWWERGNGHSYPASAVR